LLSRSGNDWRRLLEPGIADECEGLMAQRAPKGGFNLIQVKKGLTSCA
jgi:hypothetical protein